MKAIKSILILAIAFLSFSCEKSERQKIDEEKDKILTQFKAMEEIQTDEAKKRRNLEIDIQKERFTNAIDNYQKDSSRENLAILEVVSNRLLNTDKEFFWLEDVDFDEELNIPFEVEFESDNQEILKGLAYVKAKEVNGIGISNVQFDNYKMSGNIITDK